MTAKFYPERAMAAFNKATEAALTMIGIRLRAEAVKNLTARDTGTLVNSIRYKVNAAGKESGSSQGLTDSPKNNSVIAGTNLNYAQYIEFGTGPHRRDRKSKEFKENMAGWFRRHGIFDKNIQFLIMRKIRKHGTLARPYLRPALDAVKPQIDRLVALAFKTIIARGKK